MYRAVGIRSRRLLFVGLVLISIFATAGVAHAAGENFGELHRFGAPGSGQGELTPPVREENGAFEFEPWHVIGVEPKSDDLFVLEENQKPEESEGEALTRFFRLQELNAEGHFVADAEFKYKSPRSDSNGHAADAVEGIAVDPTTHRLYFLLTEARPESVPEEEESAAASLYAFKTDPNGSKLESAEGANKEGVLVPPEKLEPTSKEPGKPLLEPHGITVDPKTGEVIIVAHDDECNPKSEECEEDYLGNPVDHYMTQRISEAGVLGERYVDSANVLKSTAHGVFAPQSPVVAGSGSEERLLAGDTIDPGLESAVDQFRSGAEKPTRLVVPDAGGVEDGIKEVGEEAEDVGGALAVSPDGKTLYGVTDIKNEEVEGETIETFGVSERSAASLEPIGWTGGQQPTTSHGTDKCVLEPGILEGEHIQIAAGEGGLIFVLVPEYLIEPQSGSFPTKDAIIEFGPGGEGCPKASTQEIAVEVNGRKYSAGETIPAGQTAKLSTFVKQGDALSATWEIENEATHELVLTEEQTSDQYQRPQLSYAFKAGGKYKVTGKIKTDNLDTPSLTVTREDVVVEATSEPIEITKQPLSREVASGETAKFTTAAKGKPTPSVQWWVKPAGSASFEADSLAKGDKGTTTDTLEVPASEEKEGYEYYAEFTSAGNSPERTETVTLTISGSEAPKITSQPSNTTVTEGETASFTAAAVGDPQPTVQWEVSSDGGSTWAPVSGATSPELKIVDATLSESAHQYRAVFKNGVEPPAQSNAATLTVKSKAPPKITLQPLSTTVSKGQSATFTAEAEGAPTPTVQWEVSSDGGSSWAAIAGAISTELKIVGTTLNENGNQYRAVFSNAVQGGVKSDAATLTVNESAAPTVTLQPISTTVGEGQTATFTAEAEGAPAPTVQWEVSSDAGTKWTAISGATATELRVADASLSENGDLYRAVFRNEVDKTGVDSDAATLTVTGPPKITSQPGSTTVTEGTTATFTALASGNPKPEAQWEESSDGGATWTPIAGATSTELRISDTTLGESGHEYRAVFSSEGSEVDSDAATLTVKAKAPPSITSQPASAVVTEGQTATFTVAGTGNPKPAVQWEVSSDGGATWQPVAGATSSELSVFRTTVSESAHQYRAALSNEVDEAGVDSSVATLTVNVAVPPPLPPFVVSTLPSEGEVLPSEVFSPSAIVANASLTVSSGGAVSVKVSCPSGATTCIGTVILKTLRAVSARVGAGKSVLTLAAGSFSVSGGEARAVTLHLSAPARRLVARSRKLRARATVTAHDPAGEKVTTVRIVILRPSRSRHRS